MMTCSDNTWKLLVLNKLNGIGPKALLELSQLSDFSNLDIDQICSLSRKAQKALDSNSDALTKAEADAEKDVEQSKRHGSKIISFMDDEYPILLRDCFDKPAILFAKGCWHTSPEKSIAVIGTRDPTEHGAITTKRICEYFLEQDWSVVSGLALGCDKIAHQTAVEKGGHTVAVLSHGLHMIAPKQNEELAKKILDNGGLLLTEYPFGVGAKPHQFVQRDRIQAGLSKGVVMIQSDATGGSMHASRAILKYGRLLAIPYPTNKDKCLKEPKIEANLLLADGDPSEKMDLLKCSNIEYKNIFIIKGKHNYSELISLLSTQKFASSDSNHELFDIDN